MKCPKCGEKLIDCYFGDSVCPFCDCLNCPYLEFCDEEVKEDDP